MISLAGIAATAQIVGTVTSFFGRKYNPTNDLILSIGSMLEATNLKLDAIYEKIDLLHTEIQQLRSEVSDIPIETISLNETYVIRGLVDEAEGLSNNKKLYEGDLSIFYDNLNDIAKRLNSAVIRYMNISQDTNHDGFMNIILGHDAYYRISLFLLSVEAFEHDVEYSIGDLIISFSAVEKYLEEAIGNGDEGITLAVENLDKLIEKSNFPMTSIYRVENNKPQEINIGEHFSANDVTFTKHVHVKTTLGRCNVYYGGRCDDMEPSITETTETFGKLEATLLELELDEYSSYDKHHFPLIEDVSEASISKEDSQASQKPYTVLTKNKWGMVNFTKDIADSYNLLLSKYFRMIFIHHSMNKMLTVTRERRNRFMEVYS